MNYRDILKNVPKEYCQRVAHRIGLTDRLPASTLQKKLLQQFLNPDLLKNMVDRLGSHERSALTMLAFSCGETGVPFHLFNRKLNQMSRGWSHLSGEVLRTLAESGFVFAIPVGNMQYHYIIPEDLRRLLLKILAPDVDAGLVSPKETPRSVRNDGFALIRDTFTFLCSASQYGIGRTQQGSIYKRTQKHLLSRFEAPEDTPKVYDRINPTEGNSDRLDFIYQFCWRGKLLAGDNSNMRCSQAGHEWLRKPDAEKIADIYDDWLEYHVSKRPQASIALSICRILSPDGWALLSSIQEQVAKFNVNPIWMQTLYSQLERSFVNYLTYMGALAFASVGDDIAIQVTHPGRRLFAGEPIETYAPEESFIVQPNYEVLASSFLAPEIRWMLNHIMELHQADQVAIYKLSAQSIYDGLRSDISLDEILVFLRTHSKTGLPQNVEISIREWATRYGQIYLMDVMLLRCKNENLAHEMKASKQIGKYILGEISPTDLVVSRQKYKAILSLLEKQNYMPLPEVVSLEEE
ncbi:MAG: helicase-associated domain-containing protein [Candidatus Poribacteria bacterium]|nr:helicase-associated domain-containing protein [Candidatus Poribacteria bacterium]